MKYLKIPLGDLDLDRSLERMNDFACYSRNCPDEPYTCEECRNEFWEKYTVDEDESRDK